jgi:hypothetical protein
LKDHLNNSPFVEVGISQLWANINNKNDWNSPHNHVSVGESNSGWSGVYYLDAEAIENDHKEDIGGCLIMFFCCENGTVIQELYKPKNGQLVIFKSDTLHMVTPNNICKERISIAFNLYEKYKL